MSYHTNPVRLTAFSTSGFISKSSMSLLYYAVAKMSANRPKSRNQMRAVNVEFLAIVRIVELQIKLTTTCQLYNLLCSWYGRPWSIQAI